MKTSGPVQNSDSRSVFIETLSDEFFSATGCGVYVYFDPVYLCQLFEAFTASNLPVRMFAKQCVKQLVH